MCSFYELESGYFVETPGLNRQIIDKWTAEEKVDFLRGLFTTP